MFWSLVDLPCDPGAVAAGVVYNLSEHFKSQDDYRVKYLGETLRVAWKVAHHWEKLGRMEVEVGNLELVFGQCHQ